MRSVSSIKVFLFNKNYGSMPHDFLKIKLNTQKTTQMDRKLEFHIPQWIRNYKKCATF